MKYIIIIFCLFLSLKGIPQNPEKIMYHDIRVDSKGNLLPWYSENRGESYDHIVRIVWDFWKNMRVDPNRLPYYMNHQVWEREHNDLRGIGGDQISMAMSSWRLLFAYLGDYKLVDNMCFMADYYLSHSLSAPDCQWPNIPYPYNTLTYSGIYDGDMIIGKGYTQPDKAGSFGIELVYLYKMTKKKAYLDAAVAIANTLSAKTVAGDQDHSPLPFKVNAITGQVGVFNEGAKDELRYTYTSNWSGTLQLFSALDSLHTGNTEQYRKSFDLILAWMKTYPMQNNKWGPFFEDVSGWSDTQINAVTFSRYILENPQYFDHPKKEARSALDWVYRELGNDKWLKYGVTVVNEQTSYRVPGNSHTSRQGATELLYAAASGDEKAKVTGMRQLDWASYMVNNDGESTFPNYETWMTDGYGDFVRHYLRAMATFPELAPEDQNHLVSTSSVIRNIEYSPEAIRYETFDNQAIELLRLTAKPKEIKSGEKTVSESDQASDRDFWNWKPLGKGGILKISHRQSGKITITF